jgi:hypothetical protein
MRAPPTKVNLLLSGRVTFCLKRERRLAQPPGIAATGYIAFRTPANQWRSLSEGLDDMARLGKKRVKPFSEVVEETFVAKRPSSLGTCARSRERCI